MRKPTAGVPADYAPDPGAPQPSAARLLKVTADPSNPYYEQLADLERRYPGWQFWTVPHREPHDDARHLVRAAVAADQRRQRGGARRGHQDGALASPRWLASAGLGTQLYGEGKAAARVQGSGHSSMGTPEGRASCTESGRRGGSRAALLRPVRPVGAPADAWVTSGSWNSGWTRPAGWCAS